MPADVNDLKMFLTVEDAAAKYGVNPDVIHSMLHAESGGNPTATSPKGAYGPMQLMPGTAHDMGVDRMDPAQNIDGGVKYYHQLLQRYGGDDTLARAAYNAGPGNVDKYHGVPPFKETQHYVQQTGGSQASVDDLKAFLEAEQQPEPKSLGGFANNVVQSGGNFLGGLAQTVLHPVDTAKNLGKVGIGAVEKVVPGVKDVVGRDYTPNADAVGQFYKERYGGLDKIANTAYTDPVGMASDASALFGLGELLPGKVGQAAGAISRVTNPLAIPAKIAREAGVGMFAHDLAPTPTLQSQTHMTANQMSRLGLEKGIGDNAAGLNKIDQLRHGLANDRNATIGRAAAGGQVSNAHQLMDELKSWADNRKGLGISPTPEAANATVQNFIDEFMRNSGAKGFIPVDELEQLKEGAYKTMSPNVHVQPPTAPAKAVMDHFAEMLKQEIEQHTVGYENGGRSVKDLNAEYGQLTGLRKAIEAESKRTSTGLGSGLRGITELLAGGAMGHPILGYLLGEMAKTPQAQQLLYRAPAAATGANAASALQRALTDQP